ncbi:hypothetical protein L9F63_009667 [Diploptera punctata]|uniref:InaF motif containing 2 n=1 Tax=Diploptera punctata TaxID=6984 RepID=A0AAD8AJ38_DIPPU|nr:hypothetical protein L9F63_027923 [Diploptera punctata]KAJ9600050.1 hypothetical protein L9F63_009667 [Diploptera punctata]
MSGRSVNSNNIIVTTGVGGSVRQHTSSGMPNGIKFAGEDSKDKMYEPKQTKRLIRVLTVIAYMFSVSLAAIMLSVYYVFLWNPKDVPHRAIPRPTPTCPHPPNASFTRQENTTGNHIKLIL